MRVLLIHNPNAGDDAQPDREDLVELIRAAGHHVTQHSSKVETLATALLDESADLVAVAGGGGTIARVAQLLLGRGISVAPLPTGTANNISRTLGVANAPHDKLIAGWPTARRVPFNIGFARGPWGSGYFVEAVGVGLLAWHIPKADKSAMLAQLDSADAKIGYARKMLQERLKDCPTIRLKATLDKKDISGDYALFEAMSIQCIGPNLELAPLGAARGRTTGRGRRFGGGARRASRSSCKRSDTQAAAGAAVSPWASFADRIEWRPSHRRQHLA